MPEKFKVVISGLSGRFPECDDVDTFKEKLFENDEFLTVDDRRWPVGYKHERLREKLIPDATGKFLNSMKLDQTVFKMNKTFAVSTDITNRKILEPSFEAIIDAGINPYSLDGTNVSVFMSAGINETDSNCFSSNIPSNTLHLIGSSKTMLSNRVSYALNLIGPSFMNYVDPHGGLDSLTMGYKYVSEGLVEAAIVGVASSIVDPRISLNHYSYGLLSPDGVTRPFDDGANGYGRSEAVVCFYLQRAEDAKRIYGEIVFCDSRYLGSDLPIFVNYGESYLKTCMQQLLEADCKLKSNSSDIGFLEMNAYGHKVLDKIESNVVAELIAKHKNEPLLVGSIKSNLGHADAAAGLMAVLKALFVLDSGTLIPYKHFQKPNDDIQAFKTNQLQVVTEKRSLPGNIVAVNSLSLFGTVGLAILKKHEKIPVLQKKTHDDPPFPRLLLICGRQENDLEKKLTKIEESPFNEEFIALANDAFGQYMPLHMYRGFTLLPTPLKPVRLIKEKGDPHRPVWFIFSGMGSQWIGMGRSLLRLPLFAETVVKCDRVLRQKNIDIYHILTSDDKTLFDDIVNAFVGIITVQIGLYEVVKALGIKADGIIGHSVGENACAYADGCLSLEQAVLASWARGVASNEVKTTNGMMAAVGKGYKDMKDILPEGIQVACHNSAQSCTLSGPAEAVQHYVHELEGKNVFAKTVNVANIAYHSKYIGPIAPQLLHRLKEVIEEPKQRSSRWISTSVPESTWDTMLAKYCSAEYLTNNLLSPVLFEEGCVHIPVNAICIEFAPHGLLQAILKRSLPDTCTNIPLTNRRMEDENLNFLLSSIGMLYIAGLEPQVNNIFPGIEFPVSRGTPHLAPYCTWYYADSFKCYEAYSHPEEDFTMAGELVPVCVRDDSELAYMKNHKFHDNIMIPQSFFMFLTWKMFLSEYSQEKIDSSVVVFEDVRMHQDIILMSTLDMKYASVMIHYGSGNFQVMLQDFENSQDVQIILTGHIRLISESIVDELPMSTASADGLITKKQFYNILGHCGYKLGEEFSLVQRISRHKRKYGGEITWNGNWVTFLDALMKVHTFIDNHENVKDIFSTYIRRLEISISKYQSLEKGSVLRYVLDTTKKEMSCLGLVMRDIKYKTLPNFRVRVTPFRFVPFPNPRCQDIFEFLHLCLQIAIESLAKSKHNDIKMNLAVLDTTGKYGPIIEQLTSQQESLDSILVLYDENKHEAYEYTHVLMITDNVERLSEIDAAIKYLYVLLISPSTVSIDQKHGQYLTKVIHQSFSVNEFTLLKRKIQNSKTYRDDLSPNNQINGQMPASLAINRNVNVEDVLKITKFQKDHSVEKCLYIMDEIVSKQKLDELVQKQIEYDLPVSVFKQGELGLYRHLIQESNQPCTNETTLKHAGLLSKMSFCPKLVNYVWLDEIEDVPSQQVCASVFNIIISFMGSSPYLFQVRFGLPSKTYEYLYSGICICGFSYVADGGEMTEREMGLAGISKMESTQYDQYLQWTVPSNCSSEEVATMLYTYVQAYKLLVLFSSNSSECVQTVMINVGTDYILAEAFVVLSLYKNLEIFITVDSDEDARLFKTRFPEIHYDHILRSQNISYIRVKHETNGKGVDLMVNCLSGVEHVEASLKLLSILGIYIEVGMKNCLEMNNQIGLHPFLQLISFHIMQKRVSDILQLPVEKKKRMHEFIESGIKKGVIGPLKFDTESIKSNRLIKCQSLQEIQNCSAPTIKYDRKHTYLILATSLGDSSLLFELIEWLIGQGACKVVIALEKFTTFSQSDYRIKRIMECADAHNILFVHASKLDNEKEAGSLLKQIEKLGPLEAVFHLSIKTTGKKISNLNDLVPPNVFFVGLCSADLAEFEKRCARGSPAILLHNDEPKVVLRALPRLNELLAQNVNNNTEILYIVTDPKITNGNRPRMKVTNHFSLNDYLPRNMEMLCAMGQVEKMEPRFIEMSSLSQRYIFCKGVYPIFALPAIHSQFLQPLFKRLHYPVFSATSTSTNVDKELAHKLYSSLKQIQPTGPITVISETWTLPLALELISYAQRDNRRYKIFILEGIPAVWSERVRRLRSLSLEEFDAFCAEEIFHFIKKSKKHYSSEFVSFENKVKMLAESTSCDLKTVEYVIKAVTEIKRTIAELSQIEFTNEILAHVIWFERYLPDDQVLNLSVTSEVIVLNEPTYRSLLENPEVSRTINKNAQFSWWEYTKPEYGQ